MKNRWMSLSVLLLFSFILSSARAETERVFLKAEGNYSEIQKLKIQLTCLRIEMQEKERLKDFQFYQMAQEINRALNWSNPLDRPHLDLSKLDVFNYSLASISLNEEKQQIVISVLANQKFVNQKSGAQQRRFLADSFRLASQKLAKTFVDYDEYRDLVVRFYPLDFTEEPFVQYKEGGFIWAPRK